MRYCHQCGKASSAWEKPERAEKTPYCSPECKRAKRMQDRQRLAEKACRKCGRGKRGTRLLDNVRQVVIEQQGKPAWKTIYSEAKKRNEAKAVAEPPEALAAGAPSASIGI